MLSLVLTLTAAAVITLAAGPDAGSPDADAAAPPGPTAAEVAARWGAERAPRPGPPRSIGTYAAGCVDGAVALRPSGPGYEVMHLERRRRFGTRCWSISCGGWGRRSSASGWGSCWWGIWDSHAAAPRCPATAATRPGWTWT